jgi:anti-sigma-K factor RskA
VTEDRFVDLLGPYVLGDLPSEEEHELERHLEQCSVCRQELGLMQQTHDLLLELAASKPSSELKSRMMALATSEPESLSRGWWTWVSVAAALVVAGVLGIGIIRSFTGGAPDQVSLDATAVAPEAGGEAYVEKNGENLRVELEVWGMPALKENQYYEMWYYADDDGRISCGTFRVGSEGQATVSLTAPATARAYKEIEITREPDDGDPGTSGQELLEGSLRSS